MKPTLTRKPTQPDERLPFNIWARYIKAQLHKPYKAKEAKVITLKRAS